MWTAIFGTQSKTVKPLRFKGIAATTGVDRQGERISLKALEVMSKTSEISLSSGHWKSRQRQIGQVTESWIEDGALHVQGVLDASLPAAKVIEKALRQGEKLGLSIGGKIQHSHYESTGSTERIRVIDAAKIEHIAVCRSDEAINPVTYLQLEDAEQTDYGECADEVGETMTEEEGETRVRLLKQLAEKLMRLLQGLPAKAQLGETEDAEQVEQAEVLTSLASEIHDMQAQIKAAVDLLEELTKAQIELVKVKTEAISDQGNALSDEIEKAKNTQAGTVAVQAIKETFNSNASRQSLDGLYTSKSQKAPSWRGVV